MNEDLALLQGSKRRVTARWALGQPRRGVRRMAGYCVRGPAPACCKNLASARAPTFRCRQRVGKAMTVAGTVAWARTILYPDPEEEGKAMTVAGTVAWARTILYPDPEEEGKAMTVAGTVAPIPRV